jgi:glycosyltransferase involved in cell wall biosynthesis
LDCNLIIAGDGPLRTNCELLRLRSPYKDFIQILGSVNAQEAQTLFAEADVFTQHNIVGEISRQSECFGVSIVEAMAMGLPVVCTKNGGVIESVVQGETGFLGDPGDVEAQADAFIRLGGDPQLRQRMGDAGRVRVADFFSPGREIQQLRNIIKG